MNCEGFKHKSYIRGSALVISICLLLVFFGSTRAYAAAEKTSIPEEYNSIAGADLKVKNQEEDGSCWAFAAVAALEASIYHEYGESIALSEEHVRYSLTHTIDGNKGAYVNDSGINKLASKDGGEIVWAMTHFLEETYEGAVLESECPYGIFGDSAITNIDYLHYSPVTGKRYSDTIRVNSYINLSKGFSSDLSEKDKDAIITRVQKAIMDYGAVAAELYFAQELVAEDFTYCIPNVVSNNHAVCLVGWMKIGGKSYWIAKNSHGEAAYDKGYFYISFEDPNILSECYAYDDIEMEKETLHTYFYSNNQQIFYEFFQMRKGMKEKASGCFAVLDTNETIVEILVANGGGKKSVNIYLETDQQTIEKEYDKENAILNSPGVLIASANLSAEEGVHRIQVQKSVKLTKGEKFALRVEIEFLEDGHSASTSICDNKTSQSAFLVRTKVNNPSAGNLELLPDITLRTTTEGKNIRIHAQAVDISGITSFQYQKGYITDPSAGAWKNAAKVTDSVLVKENGEYTFRAVDIYGNTRLTNIKITDVEDQVLKAPTAKLMSKNAGIEGTAQKSGTIYVLYGEKVYSAPVSEKLTYQIKTGKLTKGSVVYVWLISNYGSVSEVKSVPIS